MTQISSINALHIDDYNDDGFLDIFLTGNTYDISTQLGKLDASHGSILLNSKEGFEISSVFEYSTFQKKGNWYKTVY